MARLCFAPFVTQLDFSIKYAMITRTVTGYYSVPMVPPMLQNVCVEAHDWSRNKIHYAVKASKRKYS